MIQLLLKSITVPKIKLSKLLYIRVTLPYPGFVRTASINQARRLEIYKYALYTRLPVTRWVKWVKLSLNFELLVNRVMKFVLGERLFNNNIFCTTCIISYPRNNHATK